MMIWLINFLSYEMDVLFCNNFQWNAHVLIFLSIWVNISIDSGTYNADASSLFNQRYSLCSLDNVGFLLMDLSSAGQNIVIFSFPFFLVVEFMTIWSFRWIFRSSAVKPTSSSVSLKAAEKSSSPSSMRPNFV